MHSYKVQTKDQILLHVHRWNKNKKPKGTICIIHGLGEHQGRYAHVAKFYIENGFQVYSYDQRGHGRSEGKRGHSPGLNHNLDDLERVIKTIPHHHLFLYGHSFGGNVLANFLLRKQPKYLKGAILSAPWLLLAKKPNVLQLCLAKIMNKIYPGFTQNNKLDPDNLSNDNTTCQSYLEDPLNHNRISARLFTDFYKSGLWALKNAEKLSTRVLLVHGMNDATVSCSGTIKFAENSKGLAEYKMFENTKHEAHNDFTREELFAYTLNWMESRLSC
jgi:alpha-beta hydrolase superfamily lysophospholipase